jgi:hypothetical protein
MKRFFGWLGFFVLAATSAQTVTAPGGNLSLTFQLTDKGQPAYSVRFKTQDVVLPSTLGMRIKDLPALTEGFEVLKTESNVVNEPWTPVLGETAEIPNHYTQLTVALRQAATGRLLTLILRYTTKVSHSATNFPNSPNSIILS